MCAIRSHVRRIRPAVCRPASRTTRPSPAPFDKLTCRDRRAQFSPLVCWYLHRTLLDFTEGEKSFRRPTPCLSATTVRMQQRLVVTLLLLAWSLPIWYVPSDDRETQATRLGGKENACSEWNLPPCVRSDQSTTVHWIRVSLETFPSVRKLGRSGLVVFADHQTDRSPASKRSRRARVARWEIDLATTAPRFGLASARSSACAED